MQEEKESITKLHANGKSMILAPLTRTREAGSASSGKNILKKVEESPLGLRTLWKYPVNIRPLSKFHLSIKTKSFLPNFYTVTSATYSNRFVSAIRIYFVDSKNLPRKSLIFLDKMNFERGLFPKRNR